MLGNQCLGKHDWTLPEYHQPFFADTLEKPLVRKLFLRLGAAQ
jgi:hypothetical protein